MIKKALILLLLATTNSFAQYYKTYNWSQDPKLHELTKKEQDESSIVILKKHIVEYSKGQFSAEPRRFETEHTIARVNDDKGISQHNTVYIPMYSVKNVVDIKARTINANGKITLLNKDNIKEVKNVEEYGDFKIFAIEGVEKGSEIEVLYTVEKEYDMYGSETIQADYKIKNAEFLFVTNGLNSNVKAYRTEEEFKDVSTDQYSGKLLTLTNIPAMIEEEYSTPKANDIAVVYQCFPEGQNITQDMFWSNVSNNVGRQFFPEVVSEKIKNDIQTITEGKTDLSPFEKATRIDNYIKTNFTIVKNNNEDLTNLDYILTNKSASDYGIVKVYAHFLKALNVDFEIVITANRFLTKFDPNFFIPGMLRDFLIYLPTEKKYIAPDRIESRVGEAPFNILGNYGLFIESDFNHYFTKIVEYDEDYSRIKRDMDISFSDELESVTISEYQEYYGHWSETNRAVLSLSTDQGKKEFKDYLTGSGIEDKEILDYKVEHAEMNQLEYNKPFVVTSTITSEALLEDAGDSYIFQVGLVIGTQSELYQETERINPIEMTYPNRYNYSIVVTIPDGYTAEGLNSLNIDKSYKALNGEKIAKFESSYKQEGNTITISIEEFYKTHEYDLNRYEEFRDVINAASDFNKAAILLKATE
ncbi:DUF3857 domain-containing protein [Ichthyenterobacterium magnum]|uniref:Uncharacterized protein DUF3857 n=1 Tax=Ichthyenterobacterium magnum TaxID=1230530 RepID=A0A420DLS1_9FLAO|nr:DUF3857 domain-containing protein [Ichthyenterobacterium magnum]RKE95183.1 uncharacterized protein DUF3857 [Ichthyenterobacterium magnum]